MNADNLKKMISLLHASVHRLALILLIFNGNPIVSITIEVFHNLVLILSHLNGNPIDSIVMKVLCLNLAGQATLGETSIPVAKSGQIM